MRALAFVAVMIAMLTTTACDDSFTQQAPESDGGGQQGYLGVYSNEVDFIQWARSDNAISGNLQILSADDADPSQTQSENLSFTGTLDGEDVSLTFPSLGTSTTWTGTLQGETLTLTIPGEGGTLDTSQMEAASVSDYNEAAEEFRRSLERQAEQELSTPESPCPYGLMPLTTPDGEIDCASEGGPMGDTEAQQTTVEDTGEEISCDDFVSAAENPSQYQAQQFFDTVATPEEQAMLDEDGDGFACGDLEAGVAESVERFVYEYYDAVAAEDWSKTHSMLDSEAQSVFTEEEWVERQEARQSASGAPSSVTDVSVSVPNDYARNPTSTATVTLADGTSLDIIVADPRNRDAQLDRVLTDEEIGYLQSL